MRGDKPSEQRYEWLRNRTLTLSNALKEDLTQEERDILRAEFEMLMDELSDDYYYQ